MLGSSVFAHVLDSLDSFKCQRRAMSRLVAVLLLTYGMGALADGTPTKPCSKAEAIRAEKDVDFLSDWDRVYRSYARFSHCDDGAIAEGYSDAVGKLLADKWQNLGRLIELTKLHKGFQRFVLKHIDSTLSSETLLKISNNARSSCPANAQRLCRLFADAADGKSPAVGSDSQQTK
jgi:hypothetical protein